MRLKEKKRRNLLKVSRTSPNVSTYKQNEINFCSAVYQWVIYTVEKSSHLARFGSLVATQAFLVYKIIFKILIIGKFIHIYLLKWNVLITRKIYLFLDYLLQFSIISHTVIETILKSTIIEMTNAEIAISNIFQVIAEV